MVGTSVVRDIVRTVIKNHPKDCVFAPNAVDNVCAALARVKTPAEFLNVCERTLKENEIYCAHEGIDRRAEYGITM